MTQFDPPPPPQNPTDVPGMYSPAGPPPWSAAAISGFVCSLLGCTGILALPGLILGIVGIVNTGEGRRRGRGLAIAAIPISIVNGALAVVFGMAVLASFALLPLIQALPVALQADGTDMDKAVVFFREAATENFNNEVSDDQVRAWIQQLSGKHGKLIRLEKPIPLTPPAGSTADLMVSVPAKFVNDRGNLQLSFKMSGWHAKLDDIQIDGVSPRDMP